VIIYDKLEAPVLWVEDTPDVSEQGRSLAIPVEYVRCVLEVKSTFSSSNVRAAMAHLKDLRPLRAALMIHRKGISCICLPRFAVD